MLTCLRMKNVIKIYHVVQEVRPLSLTVNRRTDRRTHIVIILIVHTVCGSPTGDTLMFLYIRRLRSFFLVQIFEFQYF